MTHSRYKCAPTLPPPVQLVHPILVPCPPPSEPFIEDFTRFATLVEPPAPGPLTNLPQSPLPDSLWSPTRAQEAANDGLVPEYLYLRVG